MSPLTITKVISLNNINLHSSLQPTAVKNETPKLCQAFMAPLSFKLFRLNRW